MNLTLSSLRNPAAVLLLGAMAMFLGIWSMLSLPVQLFPDIQRPTININSGWRNASPGEMESEILEPQEAVLQGLPGLLSMEADAGPGFANINLEFALETDMQMAFIEVISRLQRVPPLPRDANPPVVSLGGGGFGGAGAGETLSWFFVQQLPGNPNPIISYQRFIDDIVLPRIEAVPGVADATAFYGPPEELQVVFDPYRAAQMGISVPQIAALVGRTTDASGGQIELGRRQYVLRFAGKYAPDELEQLVLEWRDGRPVRLGDVAEVKIQRGDRGNLSVQNGNPAVGIQVLRQSGANALATLNEVKRVIEEMRASVLAPQGLDMQQSFDSSLFIKRAIGMVTGNLVLGSLLAIGVLWWFLRAWRATVIIAVAIPVSLLSTFIFIGASGHTLNVISLAGLAFAAGMVVDAAIVVLENIVRLRERGNTIDRAAEQGPLEVWGALIASTATTVAIFLPVIFLKDAEGQLFADLALTIAIAVSISMLVAVTILPVVARRALGTEKITDPHSRFWDRLASAIVRVTDSPRRRHGIIAGLMIGAIALTALIMPRMDYLPAVKRAAIDTFFDFPAGVSPQFVEQEVVPKIIERMQPYMDGEKEPKLLNYYMIMWPGGGTMGSRVVDSGRIRDLERIVREEITANLPDTQAFSFEGNLFGGFGGNRNIAMHIQSPDPVALADATRFAQGAVAQAMPGAQARAFPSPDAGTPELRLTPDDRRIAEVGMTREAVGNVVRALGDGLWSGEYFDGDQRMAVIVRSQPWGNPADLAAVPVATPSGEVVALGELAKIERVVGTSQIRRVDRRRTASMGINPPDALSLEEAVEILKRDVEPQVLALLPPGSTVRYGGSADSLSKAVGTMAENFALALVILFMIMAALFRSAKDSLLVLLTVPLATVGGVIALRVLNLFTFQPMDLLTMIGFVILLGIVVNNAILLVHQTRAAERDGMGRRDAVANAVYLRLRPIFSSTATTVVGMLPLVLMPGAGSEIYRGLATVIVGGMAVSSVFTLLLLPSFLRLGEERLAVRAVAAGDGGSAAISP